MKVLIQRKTLMSQHFYYSGKIKQQVTDKILKFHINADEANLVNF